MSTKASKAAFLRRTLARMAERGITGRDAMLYEMAQDSAEELVFDRVLSGDVERGETVRNRIAGWAEIMTERDFGRGLQEDMFAVLDEFGVPRATRAMRQRAQVHACFIGKYPRYGVYEG